MNPIEPASNQPKNLASDTGSRRSIELPKPPGMDRPSDDWQCQPGHPGCQACGGPGRAGRCPLSPACRPQRTWNGRRVLATKVGIIAMLASIVPMIWLATNPSVIRPGYLTTAHAQILSNKTAADACATCHAEASSFSQWFGAVGAPHSGVLQTDRCLDCHHQTIPKPTARWAHNLPPQQRTKIRLASATNVATQKDGTNALVNSDDIQCNACHREHHGPDHSLTAMSNQQCQTCHQQRFDRFADGHPEFGDYPYDEPSTVAFDHRTHALQHYPKSSKTSDRIEFDCRQCHQRTATGELSQSVSFEVGCQACHDKSLRAQIAEGVTLIQLPIIDRQEANSIGGWPEAAIGSPEFSRVPIQSMLSSASSPWSAAESRAFALALAIDGQSAAVQRLTANGVNHDLASEVFAALSPQVISDATSRWFGESVIRQVQHSEDLQVKDDLLAGDDLLVGDDLRNDDADLLKGNDSQSTNPSDALLLDVTSPQNDPLVMEKPELLPNLEPGHLRLHQKSNQPERFEPARMIPGGGWYRDDLLLAIRYRGGSHDDPTLRAMIESMHQLKRPTLSHELAETLAIKACLECHVGMDPARVDRPMGWNEAARISRPERSTKFSHVPHLNIASIADCKSCHALSSPENQSTVVQVSSSTTNRTKEFAPLSKANCATCHQSHAAGDQCTTCHRYHLPSPLSKELPASDF